MNPTLFILTLSLRNLFKVNLSSNAVKRMISNRNRIVKLFQYNYISLKQTKYRLKFKFQPFMGLLSPDSNIVFNLKPLITNRNYQLLCTQIKNFYHTFQTENQTLKNQLKLVLTFR